MFAKRLLILSVLLSLHISVQAFAQEQASPQAEVLTKQEEPELSEQDDSTDNDRSEGVEVSRESNTEVSPEVFNPTEEIIEDTAVSFPVDI